jgi:hypothetical protein
MINWTLRLEAEDVACPEDDMKKIISCIRVGRDRVHMQAAQVL